MYLIISDLLKPCRGDPTQTDDHLHPMAIFIKTNVLIELYGILLISTKIDQFVNQSCNG